MRSALAAYIHSHLALERIATSAKQSIEKAKKIADELSAPLALAKAQHETVIMASAEAHPELFEKLRKVEVYGGHRIGWHTSPPAVTLIKPPGAKKKQTWDGFMAACHAAGAWAVQYLRSKEEPDKDAVLTEFRRRELQAAESGDTTAFAMLAAELTTLGVAVTQDERFVIDLNLTPEVEARS